MEEVKCGYCKKILYRPLHSISKSGRCFCSNSCAAKVNNALRKIIRTKPISEMNYRKKWKNCLKCNKVFYGTHRKYCSSECSGSRRGLKSDEYKLYIINKIQKFHHRFKRIPMKREMWGIYHAARRFFDSWNKAIIAAGFKPNPVMFAEKHIANDGHKCDSLAEKIIDDWLFARRIRHKTKVPYGRNRMTADFKIDNTYVEFFGLKGQIDKYDKNVFEKEKLWEEKNLKVISIYPEDLFPKNRLDTIIKIRA